MMTRRKSVDGPGSKVYAAPAGRPSRRMVLAAAARAPKKSAALKPAVAEGATSKPANQQAAPADLQQQLALAEARIQDLETRLAAVSDRLTWIADRLESVLEDSV